MLLRASLLFAVGVALIARDGTQPPRSTAPLIPRFQAKSVRTPISYRARRRLQAENQRFKKSAWLEVITEFADGKMKYTVTGRGGSELVQNRVLLPALEAERDLLREGRDPVALTDANYRFEESGPVENGLTRIRLIPKRKDKRLLDGFLLLTADADLVEITGTLAKAPSFWTTSVTLTRRYRRIGDIRVPVSVTSVADVRIAGRSTFSMSYDFELVDGVRVRRN
jgi:hypothetical protein